MTNYKTGQIIYRVNHYEAIPYIIVGVDNDEDIVFAIAVKQEKYAHRERISIRTKHIKHNCFSSDNMKVGMELPTYENDEKVENNIAKFRKLNEN
jgi:hypothetical protein